MSIRYMPESTGVRGVEWYLEHPFRPTLPVHKVAELIQTCARKADSPEDEVAMIKANELAMLCQEPWMVSHKAAVGIPKEYLEGLIFKITCSDDAARVLRVLSESCVSFYSSLPDWGHIIVKNGTVEELFHEDDPERCVMSMIDKKLIPVVSLY